jgi:predicted CXXCH cytochrome family protein
MSAHILIVDDDALLRDLLLQRLRKEGFEVMAAGSLAEARTLFARQMPDVAILDLQLPDGIGLELTQELRQRGNCECIVVTSHGTIEMAVESLRHGVRDFLEKPFSLDRLVTTLRSVLQLAQMDRELKALHVERARASGNFIAESPAMQRVLETLELVAASETTTVLIEGETGSGKGILARRIHELSPLAQGPFLTVTCSALAETVIESELFGHEKGAFTDAHARKRGLVELAHGGTLFFDEIGELPPRLQGKLLQFLEEKVFRRLGGTQDLSVRARVVAATNRHLREEVREGRFREDLYYRLHVVPLVLPPLRERPEDIEALARHFLRRFAAEMGKRIDGISPAAMQLLREHRWPGNVRELRNVIERGVLLSTGSELSVESLPADLRAGSEPLSNTGQLGAAGTDLASLERQLLVQALERSGGSRTEAGKLLGLSRHQVRARLKKFGLEVLLAALALSAPRAVAQTLDCERCHADSEFLHQQIANSARAQQLLVAPQANAASVHAELACLDCHRGLDSFPHRLDRVQPAQCIDCHDDVGTEAASGVHHGAVDCVGCHGIHDVAPPAQAASARCTSCHANAPQSELDVHRGNIECADCHGSHAMQSTNLARREIVDACAACHDDVASQWREDTHGQHWQDTSAARASAGCTDCHGTHDILSSDAESYVSVLLDRCSSCHIDAARTANNTYHIKARSLGSSIVAGCSSCHGAHEVFPASDARSLTADANLVQTCGRCHEHANERYVQYQPHPDPTDRSKNPYLFYSFWFMNALLVGVLGVFLLHTAAWWLRLWLDRRRGVGHG